MDEWVPIKDAALRLGVSPDTIRRRMKAGELHGEKQPTPQGFVWHVELPADAPSQEVAVVEALGGNDGELVRLRTQVEGLEALAGELRSERDAWRDQAARSDEASRELRFLVRQAQSLAPALPATTEQGGEAGGQAYATHEHMPTQTPLRDAQAAEHAKPSADTLALGWRRWLRRLAGGG